MKIEAIKKQIQQKMCSQTIVLNGEKSEPFVWFLADFDTFWRTATGCFHKIHWFPLSMLIFGQMSEVGQGVVDSNPSWGETYSCFFFRVPIFQSPFVTIKVFSMDIEAEFEHCGALKVIYFQKISSYSKQFWNQILNDSWVGH